jgi:hypothetical protein
MNLFYGAVSGSSCYSRAHPFVTYQTYSSQSHDIHLVVSLLPLARLAPLPSPVHTTVPRSLGPSGTFPPPSGTRVRDICRVWLRYRLRVFRHPPARAGALAVNAGDPPVKTERRFKPIL